MTAVAFEENFQGQNVLAQATSDEVNGVPSFMDRLKGSASQIAINTAIAGGVAVAMTIAAGSFPIAAAAMPIAGTMLTTAIQGAMEAGANANHHQSQAIKR